MCIEHIMNFFSFTKLVRSVCEGKQNCFKAYFDDADSQFSVLKKFLASVGVSS